MNYTGRFSPGASDVESVGFDFDSLPDHGQATFKVPDAHLLFSGDYQRSGSDLIISDHLHRVVVPHYFHGDKRPSLVSPEGAPLDPKIIDALTGHTEYAQAAGANAAGKVVGHVAKMTGSASIVRNGVTIVLNNGDAVYQTDLVQTGSNSTLGLVLVDGTTFNLTANARLMLNDLTYDPTSTSNTSLFTLVQGAASFVAGQVAKTGDMKVGTPVAAIGIRGTSVILDISSTDGAVSISVVDQQDGQIHAVQVFNTRGDLIGTVTSSGASLTLTPTATFDVIARESNKSPAQVAQEFSVFQQVLSTYDAFKVIAPNTPPPSDGKRGDANPQSTTKYASAGSSTPPPDTNSAPVIPTSVSSAQHQDAEPETAVVVTPSSSASVSPTQSTSLVQAPIIPALPPTVAITSPAVAGDFINQSAVSAGFIISGTASAGNVPVNGQTATVAIVDSSNVVKYIYTTTVTNGVWSVNVTAAQAHALADGSYSIQATVADATGNTATTVTQTITVDTAPPTVTISTTDTTTNQPTQTISGHVTTTEAAAGATVTLFDTINGITTQIGTAQVGSDGSWSTSVTLSGDGTHSIVARDTDAAGNTGASTPVTFALNTAGPSISITAPVAGDNIINKAEAAAGVTISGTATTGSGGAAVDGKTATITIVDSTNTVKDTYTTTVTAGAWSVNVTATEAQGLADGSYSIKANVSDAAGNAAITASQAITVDETAPTIAISSVAGDNIINKSEAAAGVTISGTATAGSAGVNGQTATITIVDSTNTVKDSYTATVTGGAWSVNVTAAQAQALADGSYSIKANVSDAAGNAATTASQAIALDTLPPTVLVSTTGATTNQASQTISGTVAATEAAAGSTVTLFDTINGVTTQIGTATVVGGSWSTTVTLPGNGIHSIVAQDTDAAGNIGSSTPVVFTLATVAPTIAITSPVAGDNIINRTEAAAGVAISGTATAGTGGAAVDGQTATIAIVDSTNAVKDTYTTTVTAGAWSVNVTTAQAQALADGSYSITANVSDAVGNAATTASQAITVDETSPTIAITSPVAGDNIINKSEAAAGVTISGTATAGSAGVNGQTATITIVDSTNAVKDTYTATVTGGAWSVNVTAAQAQALADGSYSIKANVSDAAGNAATTASQAITVDETAPTIAITSPVAGDNIINKTEAAAGVTISGTATAGSAGVNGQTATITIIDNTNTVKDIYTATVTGGAWSVNVTAAQAQALVDGSYSIKANLSDIVGNSAITASQAIAVDETSPTIAITSPVAGDNVINKTEAAAGVTISGTATAGSGGAAVNGQTATITIVDSTNAVKDTYTATVTAGAWSVNVTAAQAQALADGSYSIKANVSDAAGNAATTASQAIALDTLPPTVTISTSGATTNQSTQTISGTVAATEAAAGATVTLYDTVSGVTTQIGTANVVGGSWSTSVTLSGNGTHSIVAKDTDAAGNIGTSSPVTFTLATAAPSIAITSPVAGDNIINKAEAAAGVTVSGTATAGSGGAAVNGQTATITIVDSTNAVKDTYTATVTGGAWSVNVTAAQAQALADGSYSIKANVSDAAGNAATTASQAITVDETSPSITIASPVAGDNIINKSEAAAGVTISGTATAGSAGVNGQTATITIVDSTNAVKDTYTTTVTGGAWSVNVTAAQAQALADGSYSIKANVSDAAGNAATTASQAITVDETSPTIAITSPIAGDNIINKTEAAAGVTISGTATTGSGGAAVNGQTATITIVDSTNAVKDTYTTTVTAGAWSVNVTAAQAQALADGSYSIKANVSDAVGNAATTASHAITVDETSPTIAITSPVAGDNIINKTEAAAGVTVSGTAAAGTGGAAVNGQTATITIVDSTNTVKDTYTTTVTGGAWLVNVTAAQAQALADGSYSIKANLSDAAGNAAATASQAVTVDETAPTIAITSPVAGDNIINKSEAAAGVTVSGTAAAGTGGAAVNGQTATITIVDSTNTVKDTYTATVTGGAWSVNVTAAQAQALADGSYSIKANVSDAAGNAATTASQAITVDETAPTIAITSPVAGDNIINKTEAAAGVTVSGTAAAGTGGAVVNGQTATITIVDSTNAVKDTYTTTVTGGAWSVNVTAAQAQALADGSYSIKANVSDAAGNAATTASQAITVDETPPTIAISSVAGDNIINKTEAAAGVTVSGTATAGSGGAAVNGQTATITIVDSTNAVKDTYTTTVTGGAWSVNVTAAQAQALADGSYSIKANVSDAAGNAATTATRAITVDETAPSIAIASPVAGDNIINKTEAAAGVTVSGTATAGSGGAAVNGQTATITIVDSTNTVKDTYTTTVTGGAWSVNVTAAQAQALADGSYSIKANVSDAAGNAATTASQAIALDTLPPTVAISTSGATTSQSTQTISGTVAATEAAAGATVTLYDTINSVTTQIGTATVVGGSWSTSVTLSGNGTHSIVAKDTDAAGNIGTSLPVTFTLSVIANGWANPGGGSWNTGANWSSGTVPLNTANVVFNPIGATAPYTATILSGATVAANSITLSDPEVTLLDEGALTIAASLTIISGFLEIENGGTLSLGGASSFTVDFAGTGGNLVLGNSPGFTGTINALSTATGPVTITGSGAVTASSGDAIDLTASGGTVGSPANLGIALSGAITGAGAGISAIQSANGDIVIATSGSVIGLAGRGIIAEETSTGVGNILVDGTGDVTGTGNHGNASAILAENLNPANSGNVVVSQTGNIIGGTDGIHAFTDGNGNVTVTTAAGKTISGATLYGIEAASFGTGNVSVTTALNDVITSASVGLNVYNQATAVPQVGGATVSTITVTANGTINSGALPTGSGSRPAGILAGYAGATTATPNANVFGNVTISNSANINAEGGDGIRGYNYGNGNVSVSDQSNTTITADEFGIDAVSYGVGSVSISTVAQDVINSGSSGLQAINLATSIPTAALSTTSVTAHGTINSGTNLTPGGSQPQGISAGYLPGNTQATNNNVNGTVTVDNFANVTALAGFGINTYNFGDGSITVTDETGTTVSGAQYGIQAYSQGTVSGDLTIAVKSSATITAGSLYGLAGINAFERNPGNISITTSSGDTINSGGTGIQTGNQMNPTTGTSSGQISITTFGTINSGFDTNTSGGQPAGIWAGYNPGGAGIVNTHVAGNVTVDNSATINAASGAGIGLYNFGVGSLSATLEASSLINAVTAGLNVFAQGGGNVTLINNGKIADPSGAGIITGTGNGLTTTGHGIISITNTNTGSITGLGSVGNALIQINNDSANGATLTNSGTLKATLASGLNVAIGANNGTVTTNTGGVTVNNTGTISGNVSLGNSPFNIASATFNNNAGGIWNVNGFNWFGGTLDAVSNAGTINASGVTTFAAVAGGTLTFTNSLSGTVNLLANSYADIAAAVSGGGTFSIGDHSNLEFATSVVGSIVSFVDGKGMLTLDSPSSFSGSIANLVIGDTIDLFGGTVVTGASITGNTLTVTTTSQPLTFTVSNAQSGTAFDVLAADKIVMVSSAATQVTGSSAFSSGPLTATASYIFANDAISATAPGINITSSDSVSGDFATVYFNQTSSITETGSGVNAVNITTAGASIAFVSAGTISASGGIGINTNSSSGSTDIIDYGNVSGSSTGIRANGSGSINVVVGAGATVTGTSGSAVLATSTLGSLSVSTTPGVVINAGVSGLVAENQGTSVPQVGGITTNSIIVSASGTINSGTGTSSSGEPVGILAGYLGGTSFPSTIPAPSTTVFGNVSVNSSANINAATGMGILAVNYGQGDISVTDAGGTIIQATAAGTTASGLTQYGIAAFNYGSGNTTVATGPGSTINSGGTGINVSNQATANVAASTITVVAQGAINSGANNNNSGGAASGIQAGFNPGNLGVFNGSVNGNVLVNYSNGNIVAAAGDGIVAYDYGNGNIAVNLGFNANISALNSGPSGKAPFGIAAFDYGTGNIAVTTSGGGVISSGSSGINASNQATAIAATAGALVTVSTAAGLSISSGTIPNNSSGSLPSGIVAGFLGGTSQTSNSGLGANGTNGTIIVNNAANITAAAGYGINAYNYGSGDVTVNEAGSTTVSGVTYGIYAHAESGSGYVNGAVSPSGNTVSGTGNIAINIYAGASSTSQTIINATSSYGIFAYSTDLGNISVITGTNVTINSGSVGIDAVNGAATIPPASPNSSIVVTSSATINSGTAVTGTGASPAGIIAGYLGPSPGGVVTTTFPLTGINGDVVVNNFGNITAASGDGIRAFNYGIGDVTVNDNAGTIIAQGGVNTTAGYGDGINASNEGTGDINVTTAAGTVIDSHLAASGIVAINKAPAPSTSSVVIPATSEISVSAHGTILSGAMQTLSGDPAAGILAGYNPNSADLVNPNVAGSVWVDDYANITAVVGTDGIRGINYGTGAVTIVTEAGADISAGRYGIGAFAYDGGDVSVTNHAYVTGATAAIDALATSGGTVFIDNYGMITGDVVSSGNTTFHNEAGAIWNLAGSSTFTGTSTLINDGAIDTTGVSSIATSGVLSIANNGVVEVQSGSLDVAAGVTGLGTFTIDSGGLLEFATSVAAGSVIAFQGTAATLKLDDVAHFTGSVTGFAFGDTIDLVGISLASVSVSNPGSLQIGYGTGSIALGGNYNPADFTVVTDGHGGTDVTWNHQAPVISTGSLTVTQNSNGTTTITGLQVSDSDAAASSETFTISATTGAASSGTSVSPSTGSGLLTAINTELGTGITYNPGATPPSTDKVALTVTDGFGATDTVNFVFNLASSPTAPVTLAGTSGKDVIFATGNNDTLTGGGGADQFVFNHTTGAHTITDFSTINDHIDLTALSSIVTAATFNAWLASNVTASATSPADTVISLGGTETITLHNVLAANVSASDFIVHA